MQKKLFIKTFGCQMNEYDSAKMADVLGANETIVRTDTPDDADIILFNTCSVRTIVSLTPSTSAILSESYSFI